MRKGWELVSLKDVCSKASSNITQRSIKENEGDYSIYGASGLIKKVDFYQQAKPYIGIIKDGSGYGRIAKYEAKSSVIGTLQYLIPNEDIDIDYFYYFLLGINFRKYVQGAAIPHIYFKDYKDEQFLKIPLKEQKQIVALLDKAFAAIDKAQANIKKNIENAKELFQSKLNDIFSQKGEGWVEMKIIDLCKHKSQIVGGPFGSNLKVKDYKESGVPILRLQNIGKGYFIDKDIKFVSEEKAQELSYHSFESGDIVLAKLGIPIGKTCIVPNKYKYGIVVADVVRIRPNREVVNYDFLKHFLNSDNSVNQLTADIRGATRPRVNIAEVRNLKLSIPSLKKQIEIGKQIDILEEFRNQLIANYENKYDSLEDLKKSVLQKAFAGELTQNVVAI